MIESTGTAVKLEGRLILIQGYRSFEFRNVQKVTRVSKSRVYYKSQFSGVWDNNEFWWTGVPHGFVCDTEEEAKLLQALGEDFQKRRNDLNVAWSNALQELLEGARSAISQE